MQEGSGSQPELAAGAEGGSENPAVAVGGEGGLNGAVGDAAVNLELALKVRHAASIVHCHAEWLLLPTSTNRNLSLAPGAF